MDEIFESLKERAKSLSIYGVFFLLYSLVNMYFLTPIVKAASLISGIANSTSSKMPDLSFIKPMYMSPMLCIKTLFTKEVFGRWVMFNFISFVSLLIIIYLIKESNAGFASTNGKGITYAENNGTHGTAGWLDFKTLQKIVCTAASGAGIMFGSYKNKPITLYEDKTGKNRLNKNVAIYGAPGTGKTRGFVVNNILNFIQTEESIVITDPKGEIFQKSSKILEDNGYTVKQLNLVNMVYSDRWNPLSCVIDDLSAQTFVEVIIENTSSEGDKTDFWTRSEQNLLKALAIYVTEEFDRKDANMKTLYTILCEKNMKEMDKMFSRLPLDHPALLPYNIYKQASDVVRQGVIIGLGTRLQIFQNSVIQTMTEENEIDLIKPALEKCAYFIIIPDTESTFDFIAGLFFSFLIIKLIKYADLKGGKCPKDVNLLMDEFPNVAKIPDFQKKIATMRSRRVNTQIIFQNLSQLENRYPKGAWEEILGCCDSHLFLGCTDLNTAEYVSKRIGQTTVEDTGTSKKAGFDGVFDYGNQSKKFTKRNLMNPDEILNLDGRTAILMLRGQLPLIIDKFDYSKHKMNKDIVEQKVADTKKDWAKNYVDKNLEEILKMEEEYALAKEAAAKKADEAAADSDEAKESNIDENKPEDKKDGNANNAVNPVETPLFDEAANGGNNIFTGDSTSPAEEDPFDGFDDMNYSYEENPQNDEENVPNCGFDDEFSQNDPLNPPKTEESNKKLLQKEDEGNNSVTSNITDGFF